MTFVTKTALALLIGLSIPTIGLAQSSDSGTPAPQPGSQSGSGSEAGSGDSSGGTPGSDAEQGTEVEGGGQVTTQSPAATTEGGASVNVELSAEQQTEFRSVITEVDVEPVAEVDFDISVGTVVPDTITLTPVPARIVEIVPEYEGYLFFLLPDGRIVIVEPSSLEIVLIIS